MRLTLLAFLLAAAFGCGGDDPSGPDPRNTTFAPALDIDLNRMTRTSSGLYFEDVTTGNGTTAASGRLVSVLYEGWLPDGTRFDGRTNPAQPFQFTLGFGQVIRGWDEGVTGMRVGGVRKLVIPPSLGYGNRAVGPIPTNSILVFRVELRAVN